MKKQDCVGRWKRMVHSIIIGVMLACVSTVFIGLMAIFLLFLAKDADPHESMNVFAGMSFTFGLATFFGSIIVDWNSQSEYGHKVTKTILFTVLGANSIIVDSEGKVTEIIGDDNQWYWRWEWQKIRYSALRIIQPPEPAIRFGLRHKEVIGANESLFWNYRFVVQAPIGNIDLLNRLQQATGDEFAKQGFGCWHRVVQRQLEQIDNKELLALDPLADSDDLIKQEQFKEKMRELLNPQLEDMGLLLGKDELIFEEDDFRRGCGCHG